MVSGRWLGEEKEQVERKRVLTGADTRLDYPVHQLSFTWVSVNVSITGQAVYVIKLLLFYILPLQQNQLYHPLQSVRHYVNFWI